MKNIRGSSLVEILVALMIFSMTITAVTLVFFGGQTFVARSLEARKAVEKAHDGLEALRFIRDKNWRLLTDGSTYGLQFSGGVWNLALTPDWSDGYKRTVSISTDFDDIKHTRLTVEWNSPPEGTKSIQIYQTLGPIEQGIYGDWTQPCLLATGFGTSGSSKGTDIAYSNSRVYITSYESAVGKPDFTIFSVSNPSLPVLLGDLNTGNGLKSVAVKDNFAYVVEQDTATFKIIDISDGTAPFVVPKSTLALSPVLGGYVIVHGNYAYVTTASYPAGPEVFIIDITDPSNPFVARTIEIGSFVNEISILQNIAYLATNDTNGELKMYDITYPLLPNYLGKYNAPGTAAGLSIHAKTKQRVYFGRARSLDPEFVVLDLSAPWNPQVRGSADIAADVNSLISVQTMAFLGTSDSNKEFKDYLVSAFPLGTPGWLKISNNVTGSTYHANIVYMTVRNSDILKVITSTKNGLCVDP